MVNRLCIGKRRPSLDLALRIEAHTGGKVAASSWQDVPAHSYDPKPKSKRSAKSKPTKAKPRPKKAT